MMINRSRALAILDVVAIALLAVATFLVFFYAPVERVMGQVQKVFYFHVATAWIGLLSFAVAAVGGVVYLRTHNMDWDVVGLASVEIGMVFLMVAIITGSIWARPIWNTWWTWDPRLTTVTITELIYAAYFMLRSGLDEPERRARFGAVYAIIGAISVPLTFLSIRIFRTIHPVVIGGSDPNASGAFDMAPKMLTTFLFSLLAFTVVYAALLWHRIRLGKLAEKVELMKIEEGI
jgi:heme exporter protein C